MDKYNSPEPNLMGYYSGRGQPTYKLTQRMRDGALNGTGRSFSNALVGASRDEMNSMRLMLDSATYPFAQDLAYHVLEGQTTRVVFFVGMGLYGLKNIKSMIGFDLGNNPFRLFKMLGYNGTIDDRLTINRAEEFISTQRASLRRQGFKFYVIEKSGFFYLDEESISGTRLIGNDGKISMAVFIPLAQATQHVGTTDAEVPSYEEFSESVPLPFLSHRVKRSLEEKLMDRRLFMSKVKEEKVIGDWAGHRVVVATEEEARDLESFLRTNPSIGRGERSGIEHVLTKDKYKKDKHKKGRSRSMFNPKNGYDPYNALNVVVRVHVPGNPPHVREVQIVDARSYYDNEVDPNSPAARWQHEKSKRPNRRQRKLGEPYREVIKQVFGTSTEVRHI